MQLTAPWGTPHNHGLEYGWRQINGAAVIGVRSIFVVKADPKLYGRKLTCIDLTPVPEGR